MFEGLRAVGGGIAFVLFTPRIWHYAAVPAALLLLLGCGLAGLGIVSADWITRGLFGEPDGFWGHVGGWLLTIFLALTLILTALLLAIVLAQPLSGFALEAIAVAQERALLGDNLPRSSFFTALWTSTRATVVMLVVGAMVYGTLFVVDFFFPPATVVTVPVRVLTTGWLLAWNFLDYPLSLRGLGVWARLRWTVRHFEEFTVFGVLWTLLLIVPGLFFVILPMGVAGATRLVVLGEIEEQARNASEREAD
jgi:CysZ protein